MMTQIASSRNPPGKESATTGTCFRREFVHLQGPEDTIACNRVNFLEVERMSQAPDSGPEPTRPNWKWLLAALVIFAAVEVTNNWTDISTIAHVPQIEHMLGIG